MLKRAALLVTVLAASAVDAHGADIQAQLTAAKPGTVVEVPAGTVHGPLVVPPGVGLHGAGYGKTIIDAGDAQIGVAVAGGSGAEISDLSIINAKQTDLLVENSDATVVRRVAATGAINGVIFDHVAKGRIENVVSANNRYGIVVGGGNGDVVSCCSMVGNTSLGLSLPSGDNTVAFDNVVVDSATGVYVGLSAKDLHLDYNLYFDLYTGKLEGQIGRKSATYWQSLSHFDSHSCNLPVVFRDAKAGDCHLGQPSGWSLDRAATNSLGVAEFAGAKAPDKDMDGQARGTSPDLGAFQAALAKTARPADGSFTISDDAGLKSAGVFTAKGDEICYLFHNVPLKKGKYNFWLPTRDWRGQPIASGEYQVRVAESALEWQYMGMAADSGHQEPFGASAPVTISKLAFDGAGGLMEGCDGWAEDFVDARGYDAATGDFHWAFRAGADTRGIVVDNGYAYFLRQSGKNQRLSRIDAKTGKVAPWPKTGIGEITLSTGTDPTSLALVDTTLVLSDTAGGKLFAAPLSDPGAFKEWATVAAPAALCGDHATHLLWMISGEKNVVAFDARGKLVVECQPVAQPVALAARDGVLAIASADTGKVHLFDAHDAKALKPLSTIGSGDGPYGAFAPDRFVFQHHGSGGTCLALGPDGMVAVGDTNRILVFDAHGKNLWWTFGIFGNHTEPSYAQIGLRFDSTSAWSFKLDDHKGTWAPDGYWQSPPMEAADPVGQFADGDRIFSVFSYTIKDRGPGRNSVMFTRDEKYYHIPVAIITYDPVQGWVMRKDTNHDGVIDDKDGGTPLAPGANNELFYARIKLQPNGDLIVVHAWRHISWATLWPRKGVDKDGAPVYSYQDRVEWPVEKEAPISPYTYKPAECTLYDAALDDRGDLVGSFDSRAAPGGCSINGGGTDVSCMRKDGSIRYMLTLDQHKGTCGLANLGPVSLTSAATTNELVAFDHDGLGLGTFGLPAECHYIGYWLDHPQALQSFKGDDGNWYAIIADNFDGCAQWWRAQKQDSLKQHADAFTLSAANAKALAALPEPDLKLVTAKPAAPIVRIPKLAAPMPIDGDIAKWRSAGVSPQILITPETSAGAGAITGPADASAVVRLAYQGTDLYVQVLRFDDVVSFHQPVERHFLQDCVEMCINGFSEPGFKFDITQTTDAGQMILRQRFFQNLEVRLTPEHAPRIIKVLDDAKSIDERKMIEAIYGTDLSACKVIVTEFKLPIDAETYKGAEKDMFPLATGKTFWLGFMIDDNDEPGTDVQRLMVWPATYNTFAPPSDGAQAVLE